MPEPVIVTERLTKLYGATRGIEEVDLRVARGEVFGFLGPNGAGKTTTIRLLLDLVRPTSGSARVFGLDARGDAVAIRRRVGYLPGDLALWDGMTGEEALRFAARLRGLPPDRERARELARRLDCDLSRRIGSLSKGNKQKVGLLLALHHDPDLLVLDEPTAGLDPLVQREFDRIVAETAAEGRTVFLSSHDLAEVERTCRRVGIIRDGRLVEVDDVDNLRRRSVRRVVARFARAVDPAPFAALAGVSELKVEGDRLECVVAGPMDALVKELARHDVVRLDSREPDLEELFLSYYAGGAPRA